jgi:hypothetical protein
MNLRITADAWVTGRALRRAIADVQLSLDWPIQPRIFYYTQHGTDCRDDSERVITVTINPKGDQWTE